MTSNEEQRAELQRNRLALRLLRVCEVGIISGVERMGGELKGCSLRLSEFDCLMTLRASFPGGPMVCFVGGTDLATCLLRAESDLASSEAKWRPDKYKQEKLAPEEK